MGYKNTHVVLVEVANPDEGGSETAVFGPFTSTERAAEYRDKLVIATAKEVDRAYKDDDTTVGIYVWSLREAKVRAGKARILEMLEQVMN